jgi:hypothetical protein
MRVINHIAIDIIIILVEVITARSSGKSREKLNYVSKNMMVVEFQQLVVGEGDVSKVRYSGSQSDGLCSTTSECCRVMVMEKRQRPSGTEIIHLGANP